jgi:purine-binding chemotaxis protein CheW
MAEVLQSDMKDEDYFEEDTTKDLYLTFEIGEEDYAIDVINIKEIITMTPITQVPESPDFLKGIINLRGDIVPVINVRTRFRMPEKEYNDLTCIVVLDFEDYIIGLIVDQVKGVVTIPEELVSLPPDSKLSYSNQFIRNIGKADDGVKLILDINKLLF